MICFGEDEEEDVDDFVDDVEEFAFEVALRFFWRGVDGDLRELWPAKHHCQQEAVTRW